MDAQNEFFKVTSRQIGKVLGSIRDLDEIEMKLGEEFGREGVGGMGKGPKGVEKRKGEREIKERPGGIWIWNGVLLLHFGLFFCLWEKCVICPFFIRSKYSFYYLDFSINFFDESLRCLMM